MATKTKLIYLSGSITGRKYRDVASYRELVTDYFETNSDHIEIMSPMRYHELLPDNEIIDKISYCSQLMSTPKFITTRNLYEIKQCDVVIVNLVASKIVSIGSMLELGYAKALDKIIIVIMEKGNIHTHSMINEMATFVVGDLESAEELCISIL